MTPTPDPKPVRPALGRVSAAPGEGGAPESGAEQGASPLPPIATDSAAAQRRHRARLLDLLRLLGGLGVLGLLAYLMWTPGEWTGKLMAWVLLTILADEFGGWFGYAGLVLGALGYLSPNPVPEQWLTILPLVGGALGGLLLVKHSGGPLVLPFAGALFAGTLWAVGRYATQIDPQLKLPATEAFSRSALLAVSIGLAVSFVRQVGTLLWRRARRRAGPADAANAPAPR